MAFQKSGRGGGGGGGGGLAIIRKNNKKKGKVGKKHLHVPYMLDTTGLV